MAPRALLGLALLAAAQAEARIDSTSLGAIARPKPNVLILLDTSGSMSGVAGTPFAPSSDVGGDCEHGENCRRGGVAGVCQESQRACQSSQDCRSGRCSADNRTLCSQDSDCPQGLGRCSQSGGSCGRDADCPQPRCSADKPSGTCRGEGRQACEADGDCPSSMRCQRSGDLCRKDSDCPLFATAVCEGGSRANQACRGQADCPGSRCVPPPANPCTGTPNPCQLAGEPCLANVCLPAFANTCQKPTSANDICGPTASGAPGPLRMCQVSQRVCTQDADCGEPRDCGPASSRAMIVKRALGRLVMENHDLANFGLMTFFQDGVFAYRSTEASRNETAAVFLGEEQLRRLGCYSWDARAGTGGPSAACLFEGRPAILLASADSRYRVASDRSQRTIETDFCGEACELPHQQGLGLYLGSTYLVRQTVAVPSSPEVLLRERYEGHDITVGGRSYAHFTPQNDVPEGGGLPPSMGVTTCRDACSPSCGGGWNARIVPFLDTSDHPEKALTAAQAISARMNDAAHGGWVSLGGSPIGCALDNQASPTPWASAFHYMSALKKGARPADWAVAPDPVACRRNFVLLLTDGAPNGPGDVDDAGESLCAEPACESADPVSAGCRCRAVRAAYRLRRELGVTLLVVGFSVDASHPKAAAANHNLAKAGGSERAALVLRPPEFERALEKALAQVVGRGEISAWAVPRSQGKQVLQTHVELPGWQGHLSAQATSGPPNLLWDAHAKLSAPGAWKQRRVYTWTGSRLLKIQVEGATGQILNQDELAAAGMGANAAEAERVARWLLGDPAAGNPAPLGASPLSRPVEVAPPADSSLPGGHAHFLRHARRPALAYLGASDQMVHAFVLETTTVAGVSLAPGSEAFAFVPPELLPHVRQLVVQGGQKPNPSQHILGVVGSARALDLCVSGCADERSAVWKTLLAFPQGPGGQQAFALDVTDPLGAQDPPFAVAWHSGFGAARPARVPELSDSVAAPALLFNPTPELDDYQLVWASGFGVGPRQHPNLTARLARTGSVVWSKPLSPDISCVQEYAVVTEVAVAHAGAHDEETVAGFFGDTAGQLWRITPTGGLGVVADFTCDHPLHFSPTVVQHVGAPGSASVDRDIYLVQVTNSHRDPTTASWPASRLVFLKQVIERDKKGHLLGSRPDAEWGQGGRIVLAVGERGLCAQTRRTPAGEVSCERALSSHARPLGKPIAFPWARGFRVATLWSEVGFTACEPGHSYMTVHQVEADKVSQVLGTSLKLSAPAPSPLYSDGRLLLFDGRGEHEEIVVE